MNSSTSVTGVILAGGLARRMHNRDKGLVSYRGRPLVGYAIDAMSPLVSQLIISANRNILEYQRFGWPVISDATERYGGPLAGILSALCHARTGLLLVTPCDSPLVKTQHLERLLAAHARDTADIAVAFDGERLHPVFLAIRTHLTASLQSYLMDGQRKIAAWLALHNTVTVDFSDDPTVFSNINSLEELSALENLQSNHSS